MTEWLKAIVFKTVEGNTSVGSNPTSQMYVHLFNWPVSPSLGWADPVKITASRGVLNFKDL